MTINEAGTSLAEMLQTESILLAAESQRRNRTESSSSTSSALQQLLTSDSITVPILGNSSSIVAKSQMKQEMSDSLQISPRMAEGRPKLARALLQDSSHDNSLSQKFGLPSMMGNVSLAQILQAPNESQSRVADAISQFAALPEESMESALNSPLGNSNGGLESSCVVDVLNIGDSSALDIGSFPLFSNDDSSSLFENGIAASDVGSLLEQFEEGKQLSVPIILKSLSIFITLK